jgi:hypothetical protein
MPRQITAAERHPIGRHVRDVEADAEAGAGARAELGVEHRPLVAAPILADPMVLPLVACDRVVDDEILQRIR